MLSMVNIIKFIYPQYLLWKDELKDATLDELSELDNAVFFFILAF